LRGAKLLGQGERYCIQKILAGYAISFLTTKLA
jgi:hypothetical protein